MVNYILQVYVSSFKSLNCLILKDPKYPVDLNVTENYIRFFLLGDWGGLPWSPYRTIVQNNVAKYMHKYSQLNKVHFHLSLGDNFYFDGVKSVNDKRFQVDFISAFEVISIRKYS